MPTPQFSAPNITSLEELRDYVIKLQRDLQWLLTNLDDLNINRLNARVIESETITTDKIATGAVTADKINVNELSAISANLGTITAGLLLAVQIFGAYIATANGTFPRAEMSSSDDLFAAYASATKHIDIRAWTSGQPTFEIYDSGLKFLLMYLTSVEKVALLSTGSGIQINATGGDLELFSTGDVKVSSFENFIDNSTGDSLKDKLDAKQNVISGATGSFETADNKTVTVINGIVTNIF